MDGYKPWTVAVMGLIMAVRPARAVNSSVNFPTISFVVSKLRQKGECWLLSKGVECLQKTAERNVP